MLKPRHFCRLSFLSFARAPRHRCLGDLATKKGPLKAERDTAPHQDVSLKDSRDAPPHSIEIQRQILSLRPEKLVDVGQQVYDISRQKSVAFHLPDGTNFHEFTFRTTLPRVSFPPGTKGVMYYHWTPGTPEISGELRFRLCDDVRSFSEGDDLMIPELWRPWRVPLYSMVKNKLLYDSFVPLLLQEGLVEQSLVDDISNLPKFQIGPTPVLYHCRQPFPVVLNSTGINLILLTNKLMEHVTLKDTFVGRTPTAKLRYYQFSGTYLAQFERAPKVSHPSLHLRFVKPLTDIKRLTSKLVMAEPTPGALFAKIKEDGSPPEPWKYRIDTNSGNGKALTKFQGQTRNFKIPDLPL